MEEFLTTAGFAGRVCLGLVFVAAALQKMRYWKVLAGVIGNYRLLPEGLIKPATWLLPPVELILGLGLLAGASPAISAFAAILLLTLFSAGMAINIQRGRSHIDCGCHQSFLRQTLRPALVVRNFLLAALLLPSLSGMGHATLPVLVTGAAAGLVFFLFYLTANTIVALPHLDRSTSNPGASP